jgi:hypothetical protein
MLLSSDLGDLIVDKVQIVEGHKESIFRSCADIAARFRQAINNSDGTLFKKFPFDPPCLDVVVSEMLEKGVGIGSLA